MLDGVLIAMHHGMLCSVMLYYAALHGLTHKLAMCETGMAWCMLGQTLLCWMAAALCKRFTMSAAHAVADGKTKVSRYGEREFKYTAAPLHKALPCNAVS